MAFTACMEIRAMLLHLFICEEQELREKWSNQDQNHPLYERMCQVASTIILCAKDDISGKIKLWTGLFYLLPEISHRE
jgi:hypothetical protein